MTEFFSITRTENTHSKQLQGINNQFITKKCRYWSLD